MSLQVELMDGKRMMAEIIKFDEGVDVALLKIVNNTNMESKTILNTDGNFGKLSETKFPFFELDVTYTPEYDESTFFCGFQMTGGYSNPTDYPFSINRAVVSAFPEIEVAGKRHQHIQLNSINLGGNSGAPLFVEGSNVVIGIINGNMNWNINNLIIGSESKQITQVVPLCIAYATSIKLIKEKTNIL